MINIKFSLTFPGNAGSSQLVLYILFMKIYELPAMKVKNRPGDIENLLSITYTACSVFDSSGKPGASPDRAYCLPADALSVPISTASFWIDLVALLILIMRPAMINARAATPAIRTTVGVEKMLSELWLSTK